MFRSSFLTLTEAAQVMLFDVFVLPPPTRTEAQYIQTGSSAPDSGVEWT